MILLNSFFMPYRVQIFIALAFLIQGDAYASFVQGCNIYQSASLTPLLPCEQSLRSSQDFRGGTLTVNQDAFFGVTDWAHLFTLDGESGTGKSGVFDLSSLLPALRNQRYESILIVFKGPNRHNIMGFLSSVEQGKVDWRSPFPHFRDPSRLMDVSHISFYGLAASSIPHPEPDGELSDVSTLGHPVWLFSGLCLIAFLYRNKARSAISQKPSGNLSI